MDFSDLQQFSEDWRDRMDAEIVQRMLDVEQSIEAKNTLTQDERNMLVLLELLERETGYETGPFRSMFLRHQLSLDGFNRHSMERMLGRGAIENQRA